MAMRWISTFSSDLYDTPDGEMGLNQYAEAGRDRLGNPLYRIRIPDRLKRSGRVVGYTMTTARPEDIAGKELIRAIGEVFYDEFLNDEGNVERQVGSRAKWERLRNVPGEAPPARRMGGPNAR